MLKGQLPDEGSARLGPVILPTGKLVDGYPGTGHVAWVTVDAVPDSGRVWAALSELHSHTGLVPILLGRHYNTAGLPLDLFKPEDPREADRVDVGALLENLWRGSVFADADDPEEMEQWAPFSLEWPGLAPAQTEPLLPAQRQQALDVLLPRIRREHGETPDAQIALVAARRPADVLAVTGWAGLVNRGESLVPLTAVLRSWEDRFGARLIDVGSADLRLIVERPPRTLEAAQLLAAEQVHLADDCIHGARDIPGIADRLVNGPIWTFWWD